MIKRDLKVSRFYLSLLLEKCCNISLGESGLVLYAESHEELESPPLYVRMPQTGDIVEALQNSNPLESTDGLSDNLCQPFLGLQDT